MVAERKNKKIHQSGDKSSSPRFYNSTIYTIDIWDLEGRIGLIVEEEKWKRHLWFKDYFNYKLIKNQSMEIKFYKINFINMANKIQRKV